jgi:hypothetical protein
LPFPNRARHLSCLVTPTLNEVFTRLSSRRRYEVWFLRFGLADGSGAWWFRYLLTNPGRGGCGKDVRSLPVQVWATYFPRGETPQSWIQGFPIESLALGTRGASPFSLRIGENAIDENSCRGQLRIDGHEVDWNLHYKSNFRVTLSNKGWIGFSRTPHSDAVFSGEIRLDGQVFSGDPLGFGLQGHNCGFRHRHRWTWAHVYFVSPSGAISTLEALTYEMPFGLTFRKAVLWHDGLTYTFRKLEESQRDRRQLVWNFRASGENELTVEVDGSGPGVHRLPYVKTDCSGTFEVANNSLARAQVTLRRSGAAPVTLSTESGAVLEMVGD